MGTARAGRRGSSEPEGTMSREVSPIPEGYRSITPYLVVKGAAEAVTFYERAFGAIELGRMPGPDGRLMHVDLRIGDSHLFLADEALDWGVTAPPTLGGTPVSIHLYVE